MIERVMLLDAVLDDRTCTWLGPAIDKRRHFMRHLENRLQVREYPHFSFGDGPERTVRYFPDKFPIAVLPELDSHGFVYLVTHHSPMDFRVFLLRHVALFRVLFRWTIRLLFPRSLWKARLVYQHAAREHLARRLEPAIAPRSGPAPVPRVAHAMAVSVAAVVPVSLSGGEKRRVLAASSALDCGSDRPDDLVAVRPENVAPRRVASTRACRTLAVLEMVLPNTLHSTSICCRS